MNFRTMLLLLLCAGIALPAIAQYGQQTSDEEAAAACAACGTFGCGSFIVLLVVCIVVFALHVALLVWVARDAKSRGMDSAVLWMILVICTGLIGLLIYIFSRPQGELVQCASCNNSKLRAMAKCPHCGNA
ncbi:MAG: hypothetical protein KJ052_10315 [Candidatus Hydrogenedentes bacterium]|nr:hypothetical protein [Candidatus Hydrogenedentota bacterium]